MPRSHVQVYTRVRLNISMFRWFIKKNIPKDYKIVSKKTLGKYIYIMRDDSQNKNYFSLLDSVLCCKK